MSGPLSTNEIEDVVSSVRRLVSTEPRPRVMSCDLGQDKLILTPSLRIVPEGSEHAGETAPLVLTTMVAPVPDVAAPAVPLDAPLVEAEWEDELWTPDEPLLAEIALGAEEAEVVSSAPRAAAEPVIVADATDLPAAVDALDVLAEVEVLTAWPEAAADWTDETGISEPEPEAEPEQVPEPITAPDAELPHDDLDVAEMLTAAVVEDEAFHIMDQEELHALVRSIIRQELQGTLGERITRNVRKLVRAEINRALAARALD